MHDEPNSTPPEPAQPPTGPLDKKRIGLLALGGVIALLVAIELLGHLGKSTAPDKSTSASQTQPLKLPPVTKDVIGNFEKQTQQDAIDLARLQAQKEALDRSVAALAEAPSPFGPLAAQPGANGITDPTVLAALRQQQIAMQQQQIAGYTPPLSAANPAADPAKQEAAEQKRRELASLRASNVALDLRGSTRGARAIPADARTGNTAADSSSPSITSATPASVPVPPPLKNPADPENEAVPAEGPAATTAAKTSYEFNSATGKLYRLFEGKIIETVLTNRVNGAFSGPIDCMVTTDIYSHDKQALLIPQGSRLLGRVSAVISGNQQRLFVAFHRIIMPDGYSVHLDKFAGLNVVGETGLRDIVNHHYVQIFGASLALAAIGGVAQIGNTFNGIGYDPMVAIRAGISRSMGESAHHVLDRFLNQLPTFIVRERARVKIYLSNDLLLPAYANHTMPSDL